jgi:hypothetical protein
MPNPLRKEKVIDFVKRYPHDSGFQLLNSARSIIVRPGQEEGDQQVGDSNIPDNFAQCSVGLVGTEGNPEDFNDLLTMWKDGTERSKLNPIALMRLWAAIYRTYYGWVRATSRLFPSATSNLSVVTRRLNPATDYSVTFQDGAANIYTWTPSLNTSSGFVEGYLQGSGTEGAVGIGAHAYAISPLTIGKNSTVQDTGGALVQTPLGSFSNPQNGEINVTGQPTRAGLVTAYYNNSSAINTGILGGQHYVPFLSPTGITYYYGAENTATPIDISEVILTANNVLWFSDVPDNDTDIAYVKFQKPYNLIAPMSVGPYKLTLVFDEPITLENLHIPHNFTSDAEVVNAFVMRSSFDGITYDEEVNYGDYYNTYNTQTDSINGPLFFGTSTSIGGSSTVIPNARTFNAYITQVYTRNTPAGTYTGVPTYSVNQAIVGHTNVSVSITKNGVPQTATFRAYAAETDRSIAGYTLSESIAQQASEDDKLSFNILSPYAEQRRRLWELVDEDDEIIIMGFFDFSIMNPNRIIKSLEIEFGPNNVGNSTSLFIGYTHPVVVGTKQTLTSTTTSNLLTYSQVDLDDAFYTTNNPESYSLTGFTINDLIAQNAYQGLSLTNKLKWTFLPLTLPYNTSLLRTALSNIDFVLTDLEPGFEPDEDYLDNTMLRLPNDQAEWDAHVTLAEQLNRDPVRYWLRLRTNEVLNELINHCKGTCLKFWRLSREFSVRNYQDYTELNLDIQPETRDVRSLPFTQGLGIANSNLREGIENLSIQTYLIADGAVDIEDNPAPGQLWFLSGGGFTSVDLASNILSEFIDNLLAEGAAGNTPQNPNLL